MLTKRGTAPKTRIGKLKSLGARWQRVRRAMNTFALDYGDERWYLLYEREFQLCVQIMMLGGYMYKGNVYDGQSGERLSQEI